MNDTSNPTSQVQRLSYERIERRIVNIVNHSQPDFTLMIQGSIQLSSRSDILLIERDIGSKGKGYITQSYLQVLKKGLLSFYKPRTFFQQDNTKIHISKAAKEQFEEHRIWVIDWPTYSPDMNPIEYIQKAIKGILHQLHPEIHLLKNNQADIAQLKVWIREVQWLVPQTLIDTLIRSIPNRLTILHKAKGWYTKY